MLRTTCIKGADWVIAWDSEAKCHVYRRNQDVAFTDDRIVFVGSNYTGAADETVDGRTLMVMPGLVNIHSHPDVESSYRGIREEHGVPDHYMTGLYERSVAYGADDESQLASAEVSYCELLLGGVTSIADLSVPYPGWAELAAKSGIRAFLAPGYASARWHLDAPHVLGYNWDEERGRRGFETALKFIDELARHPSGRLSGMIYPLQIDTCTEDLLRDSVSAAAERNLPLTTHASQSVQEFQEMIRRHGKTPIQWAHQIGLLGPRTTLGHAIFIDEHSWLHWWTRTDLKLLSETRTSVAHCPSPFARYGQTLEDFGRYLRAAVNMGFGTDVAPHNLLEEMRLAAILARVAAEDINTLQSSDILHASTVGGANILLREDIGRLSVGAKADIVLVDLENPLMQPARDPWRSLLYTAAERAVRDVFVDGLRVVENHRVKTLDHCDALARLTEAQIRMEEAVPKRDPRKRHSQEISPLSLGLV